MAKLQLLPAVKRAISIRDMHYNLLEADVLSRLREWVEPRGVDGSVLPSLTVRTTVYELLMELPCQQDHLKKSGIGIEMGCFVWLLLICYRNLIIL